MFSTRTTGALVVVLVVLLVLSFAQQVSAYEELAGSVQYAGERTLPVPVSECDPSRGGCPFYNDEGCLVYPEDADEDVACATTDYVAPAARDTRRTTDTLNPQGHPNSDAGLPLEDECDPAQEVCTEQVTSTFAGDANNDARRTEDTLNGGENTAPTPADEPPAVAETPSAEPSASPPSDDPEQYEAPSIASPVDALEQYPTGVSTVAGETAAPVEEYQYAAELAPQPAAVAPQPPVTPELDALREDAGREEAPDEDAAGREKNRNLRPAGEIRDPRPAERKVEKRQLADQEPTASTGERSTAYTLGGSFLLIAGVALAGRFFRR